MGDAAAAGDRGAPSRFVRRPGPPGRRAAVMRRGRQAGNVGGGEVGAGVGQVLCFRRLSEPYRPGDQGVGHVQGPCRHQGPGRPAPPRRRRPLVTNALRHAPGPGGLLLEMHSSPARLRITVRDTSRAAPRLRVPDPYRIADTASASSPACAAASTSAPATAANRSPLRCFCLSPPCDTTATTTSASPRMKHYKILCGCRQRGDGLH